MDSKTLFTRIMLLALALHLSTAALALPVIHVISSVGAKSPPVIISYKARNSFDPIQLKSGQEFQIKVEADEVYFLSATLGLKFTSVHVYEPSRDGGRAAVYWRANDWGLSIGYDNANFKPVAPWESG